MNFANAAVSKKMVLAASLPSPDEHNVIGDKRFPSAGLELVEVGLNVSRVVAGGRHDGDEASDDTNADAFTADK